MSSKHTVDVSADATKSVHTGNEHVGLTCFTSLELCYTLAYLTPCQHTHSTIYHCPLNALLYAQAAPHTQGSHDDTAVHGSLHLTEAAAELKEGVAAGYVRSVDVYASSVLLVFTM
jgi:hypothetical protein